MRGSVDKSVKLQLPSGEAATQEQFKIAVFLYDLEVRKNVLMQNIHDLPERSALSVLREIDAAISRISQGCYGRCVICDEQISWTRLEHNPLARHCEPHRPPEERESVFEDNRIEHLLVQSPFYPLKRQEDVLREHHEHYEAFAAVYSLEEMVKDNVVASEFQYSLLPEQGLRSGPWETSYCYAPAQSVSGDYCDLIRDSASEELFFCFGDGMGHGIVGSIISSLLHSLFRTLVTFRSDETITTLVERANRLLCEEFRNFRSGCYATVIFGRARNDGTVELVNAGHPPAFLLGSDKPVSLEATGLPLGLFYSSIYESRNLVMTERQVLLMYTDGVTEAEDRSGAEYGRERLARAAVRQDLLSAEHLVDACVRDIKAFTADSPLKDDQTILVVRRI